MQYCCSSRYVVLMPLSGFRDDPALFDFAGDGRVTHWGYPLPLRTGEPVHLRYIRPQRRWEQQES
jgi:hypothetical protein